MEIAVMKPTDRVDFFNTVFVEKAERRYPLPEASALITHLKLVNGRLTEEASTQIRSLLEKNPDLKLAGL
eukprot:gene11478-8166_t